ncbi:hypothetical protein M409DRAFT_29845 [Zasmidium cellare ATCC 36951]|uniref:Major facilitator superfamily (MFS) profile domain-containing protein n=1 Tax=Zasmidium cellare ATCC 36951 TaxID=1080233 RepID=A0A6A6BYI1_ZASCE|nr:uncharacterized protein M409DRAFT_29845 [Zasmidium cellare ATCC 36951]KAF2159683.1 hypothetical protein M409DRAFT_29845 [Zasmidium cellare ATCC 36951]
MDTEASPKISEFNVRSTLVLAASALALFCTAGFINAFGVFQTYYTVHYLPQESAFDIAWIGSMTTFLFFGLGFPAGLLSDKTSPIVPISIGAVCQVVAVFMISLCKKYYQFFLAQGVLLGIAMALITIPTTSVAPLYFQRNRAFAQGISVAGSSLGGVIWPIMLDQMLNADGVSFGWTIRSVGFLQLLFLAIVIVGVRRPKTFKAPKKDVEDQTGTVAGSEEEKDQAKQQKRKRLAHLRTPSFMFLCGGLAIFYFGFFAPFFYVSTYAITLGVSESFSIYLIAILNAASSFGRILPGFIADRVGHFNILVTSMFLSAIVCFCWKGVDNVAGLVVWSAVYGFVSGAVLSLQIACASLVSTKETMGAAIGIVMGSIALTALFGTPIAGELVKSGYLALSMFAGATMLVGAVLVLFARLGRSPKLLAKA